MNWPKVQPKDHGIRPAGPQNECFYCHQKVGQEHTRDCTTIHKKVEIQVTLTFPMIVEVPYKWDAGNVDFKYQGSSWCASNITEELVKEINRISNSEEDCLCPYLSGEYVRTVDETPIQEPEWEELQTAPKFSIKKDSNP